MAESTCLLRSFSNPTDTSSTAKEGDPLRLLGESISFGRFMSESLAWEKWSAFSHSRYVEEAEKFSKPGSVAEKKAYFEAHYKRKAAEKAAALAQEANASFNRAFDSDTRDGNCNNSSMEISSKADGNVTVFEQLQKDDVNYQVVDYADTNKNKCDIEQSEVDISKVERPADVPQPLVDTNLNGENSILVDNSNQIDNVKVHEKIAVPKEEEMLDPDSPGQVKRREVNSSPTLSTKARTFKPPHSLAERKVAVQPRNGINGSPKSKKFVGDSVEKKRLSARSLHMSINLPSCPGETSKIASMLQQNRKKTISNFPNILRDRPVASKTSIRASNDVFNQASANLQSESRMRTERLLNKSVSGGVTANAKLASLSVGCPISSSTGRSNPPSSTTASPFKFRSEERAAKRKEFFQKMDEIKSKEAERVQLQRRCKEKTEHDHKKLRQSCRFKPQKEDRKGELQLPSNETRKTSLTQSQSPKPGRKVTSSTGQGKSSRNSWKPPISTNTSRLVAEKINQTTRRSVTSLSKKIAQENASPNIQR